MHLASNELRHAAASLRVYEEHAEGSKINADFGRRYVSDLPIEVALSDNLGFGGHNAALVFKRYVPPSG